MARIKRVSYLTLGLLSLATGVVGLIVPLLPTTVFLLIAAWAFGRSSERLHRGLLGHPRFGPVIRAWQEHGAIPPRAKRYAVGGLSLGYLATAVALGPRPLPLLLAASALVALAIWILRRPEGPQTAASGTDVPKGMSRF